MYKRYQQNLKIISEIKCLFVNKVSTITKNVKYLLICMIKKYRENHKNYTLFCQCSSNYVCMFVCMQIFYKDIHSLPLMSKEIAFNILIKCTLIIIIIIMLIISILLIVMTVLTMHMIVSSKKII